MPFEGLQFAPGKRPSSRFTLAARCTDAPFDLSLNELMVYSPGLVFGFVFISAGFVPVRRGLPGVFLRYYFV
jgi:hypothetical protein